jgi:roadblock/LC7 domain-containing protein
LKNIFAIFLLYLLFSVGAYAQHGEHNDQMDNEGKMNDMDSMQMMTHSYSLSLPMNRNSSGTAWQPDATPMYGYMIMGKKWDVMVHGSIFLRYNYQDITHQSSRSDSLMDRVDAPNWIMLMANRKIKE